VHHLIKVSARLDAPEKRRPPGLKALITIKANARNASAIWPCCWGRKAEVKRSFAHSRCKRTKEFIQAMSLTALADPEVESSNSDWIREMFGF
jgi:hypothetical protein